ncbi:hypothetical protein LJK88_29055 [Paenibacillus sp. P26]|nr:hypothetical protein LJK88_29055 [Paenibacillus sp. P26]
MKNRIAVYWQYGATTHTGWFRTLNEDRSLLRMGTSGGGTPYAAAVLADGMGGTEDGGLASETAVQMVKEWLDARRRACGMPRTFGTRWNGSCADFF